MTSFTVTYSHRISAICVHNIISIVFYSPGRSELWGGFCRNHYGWAFQVVSEVSLGAWRNNKQTEKWGCHRHWALIFVYDLNHLLSVSDTLLMQVWSHSTTPHFAEEEDMLQNFCWNMLRRPQLLSGRRSSSKWPLFKTYLTFNILHFTFYILHFTLFMMRNTIVLMICEHILQSYIIQPNVLFVTSKKRSRNEHIMIRWWSCYNQWSYLTYKLNNCFRVNRLVSHRLVIAALRDGPTLCQNSSQLVGDFTEVHLTDWLYNTHTQHHTFL